MIMTNAPSFTPVSDLYQRLNIYLFSQLVTAFLFSTFAVTFVILFTQSFRMLSLVMDNSSTMLVFFKLMGLSIPTFLPLILPLGLGVAVIFVYNKMAIDSELVIMRAVGISPFRQALPGLALSGIVLIVCFTLTLWLAPAANRSLVALQYQVRDSYAVFLSRPGNFNDITEGLTFYARRRGPNGSLEGILIHDVRNPQIPVTIMADTGQVIDNHDQPQIIVFQGRRQELDTTSGHLSELAFDQYVLDLNALRANSSTRSPDPREESLFQLTDQLTSNAILKVTHERLVAEIHQRLASPFLALCFTLIGLSAILVGDFNRRGLSKRIFIAALAIIFVQAGFMSITGIVAHYTWLAFVQYFIAIVPVLIGFGLINIDTLTHSISNQDDNSMRRVKP